MPPTTPPLSVSAALQSLPQGIAWFRRDSILAGLIIKGTLVAGIAFVFFLAGALWGVWHLTDNLGHTGLGGVLVWIARVASLAAMTFVAPVLFAMSSGIVMPFFRSRIFARARTLAGASPIADLSLFGEMKCIAVEGRRLLRLLAFMVVLLPLHLIPVLGSLAYALAAILLAANSYGWDLLGYHFEVHRVPYAEQKRWLRDNRLAVMMLGFGATALCLMPIAQIFFINSNSAAAGVLSAHLEKQAASAAPRAGSSPECDHLAVAASPQ